MKAKLRVLTGLLLLTLLVSGCPTQIDMKKVQMFIPKDRFTAGPYLKPADPESLVYFVPESLNYVVDDRCIELGLDLSQAEKLKMFTNIREKKLNSDLVFLEPSGRVLAHKKIDWFKPLKIKRTIITETFDQIKCDWVKTDSLTVVIDSLLQIPYNDTARFVLEQLSFNKPEDFNIYKNNPVIVYADMKYMNVKRNTFMHFVTQPRLLVFKAYPRDTSIIKVPPEIDTVCMKINDHLIRMGWSDLQIKKVIAIYQGLKTNMPVEAAVKRLEQRDSLTFSLSDLIKFIPDSLAKRQMADSARGFRMGDEFLRGEYIVDRYPFMKEAIVAVSSYLNYLLVPNLSDSVEYESRLVGFADQMEVHKLPNSFSTPLFYYSGQNIPNYLDRRVYYKKIREKYILVETNECLERVGNIFVDNFQLSQARAYSVFNFMREFLNPDKIDLRYALVGYGVTPQTKETKFRRKVDIIFKRCD